MTEVLRALAVLLEPPVPEHDAVAAALGLPPPAADEHTDVLVFQAYPYASVYLGAEGMLGGEARDRIGGMWRALGAVPPAEPDHLSVLLAALAALTDGDGRGRTARAALFWEHVASWMPPFLATLGRIGGPFHAAWATTLAAVLDDEAVALGPPARLPLHLREAGPLTAPAGLDDLLATLLAPARIGFVLVRDDLARCAAELGLGLRAGERRFALRGLLGQDAARVLAWLAGEARAQRDRFAGPEEIRAWWAARADAGAAWLDELAAAARRDA
jgi:hypothetical protein